MSSYKNLLGPDGSENNMGGTKQYLSFIRHSEILTWAVPALTPTDPDDKYVIATAHTCATGCNFAKLYTTNDTSELEAAMSGQIDGRSVKLTAKFFYPGSKKALIRFINESKSDTFLFLIPLTDGTIIQLGSADFCAYVSQTFKSDKTTGRGKGAEFTVECWMDNIYIYSAAIPYTPAA